MTSSTATAVDPEIYQKSGNVEKHLDGVKKQYDTKEKLEFYAEVMGDGTANIHFGMFYFVVSPLVVPQAGSLWLAGSDVFSNTLSHFQTPTFCFHKASGMISTWTKTERTEKPVNK